MPYIDVIHGYLIDLCMQNVCMYASVGFRQHIGLDMSSKRIFSLRLNEEVREKLLEAADTQSMTVTALINRYILEGLAHDQAAVSLIEGIDSGVRVTQPARTSISAAEERIEELLFQVLVNQRQLIETTKKNEGHLTSLRSNHAGNLKS